MILWTAFFAVSCGASLLSGEAFLRVVFRDAGRTTLGGPGGQPFEYTYNPRSQEPETRHPVIVGEKEAGVTRIVVQGDSITWGVGVKRWTDLYPSQLLAQLNRTGARYELTTSAVPGYNIDRHAAHIEGLVDEYAPDVLVYQWYANDLDVGPRQRVAGSWWQGRFWHQPLVDHSYLYFFLQNRLDQLTNHSYRDHLLNDFGDGRRPWALFRDSFHRWAVVASARVPRTIVLLYPQVPFPGENPLGSLHARVTAVATDVTRLDYPADAVRGVVGHVEPDPTARGGFARRSDGQAGQLVRAGEIPLEPGHYLVTFRVRLDAPVEHPAGHLRVATAHGTHVLADVELPADHVGEWVQRDVEFDITDSPYATDVEFDVDVESGTHESVDVVGLPVRYSHLEVLDPTAQLNTFDTHSSIFDAHPNERAHGVLAGLLFERIKHGARH